MAQSTGKIPIHLLLTPATDISLSAGNGPVPGTETRSYERRPSNPASPPYGHTTEARRSSLPVQMLVNTNALPDETTPSPVISNTSRSNSSQFLRVGGTSPTYSREAAEQGWDSADPTRRPRAPRPSYSEEQKFFIMYARIMRDHSWPEIEDRFAEIFGQRSKGGLTSVYYRARKDWGLSEVLKSGPGSFAADCREVERRALNFSAEFLAQIGYLEQTG